MNSNDSLIDWLKAKSDDFKSIFLYGTNPYANKDYVQCAINIANNNYYGYGHTWRTNGHTISCAGQVGVVLTYYDYGLYDNHCGIYLGQGASVEARGPCGSTDYDDIGWEVAVHAGGLYENRWEGYFRIPNKHSL